MAEPRTAQTEARADIERLASHLYILAWAIEGVAVTLGLGMALAQGGGSVADFLLGGGGFVMVACAELSKIPLATFLVQSSSRRSQLLTLTFLLLMSFITFETIFFSLERGFNARTLSVRLQAEDLARIKKEHAELTSFAENPSERLRAARAAIDRQREEIQRDHRIETGKIDKKREDFRNDKLKSDLPKEISDQIQANETQRKTLVQERDRRIAAIEERAQKDIRFLSGQLDIARKAADTGQYADIEKRIAATRSRAGREKARTEAEYRGQLSALEHSSQTLSEERLKRLREMEDAIKPALKQIDEEEQRIYAGYIAQRDDLDKKLADFYKSEAAMMKEAASARLRADELGTRINDLETRYRRSADESQLHRVASAVAGWWTGNHYEPHAVPESYVRRVAGIWFGSMAALGALGGSVVAMISQLLVKRVHIPPAAPVTPVPRGQGLRPLDRLLLTLRHLLVRRVSKVRVKTVEVVKTRREVVAVPIPVTGMALDKLQKEFRDLSGPLSEQR